MSIANDTCNLGPTFWDATAKLRYIDSYILLPIHVIFGIPGQVLCVIACVYQSKTNSAYAYQTFCTISDIFELAAYLGTYILRLSDDGVAWILGSYPLMWYAAHMAIPLMHVTMMNSLFGSVAVSADRLLALATPVRYKNFNHTRRQKLCFAACILFSIAIHVFEPFRYFVGEKDGHFTATFDHEYSSGLFANFSAQFVNALRVLGVVALIVCNALMIYYYRKRFLSQNEQISINDYKKKEARDQEKCLVLITVFQAVLVSAATFGEAFFTAALYAWKDFFDCGYLYITSSILNILDQMSMVWEFYIWLVVSKQFRKLVTNALKKATQLHSVSM